MLVGLPQTPLTYLRLFLKIHLFWSEKKKEDGVAEGAPARTQPRSGLYLTAKGIQLLELCCSRLLLSEGNTCP